jgi:hypothetical protein
MKTLAANFRAVFILPEAQEGTMMDVGFASGRTAFSEPQEQ